MEKGDDECHSHSCRCNRRDSKPLGENPAETGQSRHSEHRSTNLEPNGMRGYGLSQTLRSAGHHARKNGRQPEAGNR